MQPDLQAAWPWIVRYFEQSLKRSLFYTFATVDADGSPHLAPYASLVLNSIFLKKNHGIEVLGLILLISLLIWRLMEHCIAPLYQRYRQYHYRLEGQTNHKANFFYDDNQVSQYKSSKSRTSTPAGQAIKQGSSGIS